MKDNRTILVVGDEPASRKLVEAYLVGQGYDLAFADGDALGLLSKREIQPDLVLLALDTPEMVTTCSMLRADPALASIPVLVVAEADDRGGRLLGMEAGADDFVSLPLDAIELRARVRTMMRLNRYRRRVAAYEMESGIEQAIGALDAVLESWGRALELRGIESEGHTERVTDMALQVASAMGMGDGELVHVRRGALVHDIGKMGISDRIMFKVGPLDEEEWEEMHQHPVYAYELLLPIEILRPALDIPYCHHEKWDGSGYPQGLGGTEIPLAARVFAVVDVWDALHSDRSYRPAWSNSEVDDYLHEQSGHHFDPEVIRAFFGILH
jgi:putative two-component system response regulator